MAQNKRINHNIEIFNQAKAIDAEYMNKIHDAFVELLSDKTLSIMDVRWINMFLFTGGLYSQCLNTSSYSEWYSERYSAYIDYVSVSEAKKYQVIQDLYQEGIGKINELRKLFQDPKKFIRLENIETQEEYNKLANRYCNNHIEGRIKKDEYLELMNKLKEKGTELKLILNNF